MAQGRIEKMNEKNVSAGFAHLRRLVRKICIMQLKFNFLRENKYKFFAIISIETGI
jgi:hypothetical protein